MEQRLAPLTVCLDALACGVGRVLGNQHYFHPQASGIPQPGVDPGEIGQEVPQGRISQQPLEFRLRDMHRQSTRLEPSEKFIKIFTVEPHCRLLICSCSPSLRNIVVAVTTRIVMADHGH